MSFGARADIRLDALYANFKLLKSRVPGCKVMAAVKANAYGHGIITVSRALHDADAFAVARLVEAKVLRDAGIGNDIVLMGGILVHSFSAYQTVEQASRPTVLKALDVLYLFWQRQQSGRAVREIEMLNGQHAVLKGLDSETWRELRDVFIHTAAPRIVTNHDPFRLGVWVHPSLDAAPDGDSVRRLVGCPLEITAWVICWYLRLVSG